MFCIPMEVIPTAVISGPTSWWSRSVLVRCGGDANPDISICDKCIGNISLRERDGMMCCMPLMYVQGGCIQISKCADQRGLIMSDDLQARLTSRPIHMLGSSVCIGIPDLHNGPTWHDMLHLPHDSSLDDRAPCPWSSRSFLSTSRNVPSFDILIRKELFQG